MRCRPLCSTECLKDIFFGLALCESAFNPFARSSAGAEGMFQFMPATGRIYGLYRPPGPAQRQQELPCLGQAAARPPSPFWLLEPGPGRLQQRQRKGSEGNQKSRLEAVEQGETAPPGCCHGQGVDHTYQARNLARSAPSHALGEQVVNARQLLLSSGLTGYIPERCLAWRIPDVHGDLAFAAIAERYGLLGTIAVLACWAAIVLGLFRLARLTRNTSIDGAYLLAGVAILLVIQVVTQIGGTLGLMPFTGVPLPWVSHGLTASLIFSALMALALAAAMNGRGEPGGETTLPVKRLLRFETGCAAFFLVVAGTATFWQFLAPGFRWLGARGAEYVWVDPARMGEVNALVSAGVFERDRATSRVKLVADAYKQYRESSDDEPDLVRYLDGLRFRKGEITPLPYLVTNPNRYARRARPRGWILARDRKVLAMNDVNGERIYPLGNAALHTVGVPHGLTSGLGLESSATSLLTGSSLSRTMRLHAFAADIHHGADMVLTIDTEIQRHAYDALDKRNGAVVVLDLKDGSLLGLVSSPAPHPDESGTRGWSRMLSDEHGALLNRATASTATMSPPGSTFKMLMAAAAMMNRSIVDPDETYLCTGYDKELQVRCPYHGGHGKVDLARALTVSCNTYFARLAVELGPDRILETARLFGMNPDTPFDLAANIDGVSLPALRSALTFNDRTIPSDSALARVGFGQGPVDTTPLQIARIGSVFATGGELVDPFLVRAVALGKSDEASDRREVVWEDRLDTPDRTRVIPSAVAKQINRQLRAVFESKQGTAYMLPDLWHRDGDWKLAKKRPGLDWEKASIAGKTGSAWREIGDKTDDAWIVTWAPATKARVLVCVMIEDAGSGAKVAGPIALDLMTDALNRLGAKL
jgi:peptidoglycan glycosyltransferase